LLSGTTPPVCKSSLGQTNKNFLALGAKLLIGDNLGRHLPNSKSYGYKNF
ncbi:hypothetical protein ACJX0J_005729, partial [Zea mays]